MDWQGCHLYICIYIQSPGSVTYNDVEHQYRTTEIIPVFCITQAAWILNYLWKKKLYNCIQEDLHPAQKVTNVYLSQIERLQMSISLVQHKENVHY